MNIVIWVLAGAAIAWIAYARLDVNLRRGPIIAVIIGIAGGFLGGKVLAPMFSAAPVEGFSLLAFLVAVASAVGCVTLTDMIYERFGV